MTQLSITFRNGQLVRHGLQNLRAEVPKISKQRIYGTLQDVVREVKTYPPERTNQRYIRTGRLGVSWLIVSIDNGYSIRNNTPYTKYVVGNAYGLEQAWMHISTDQGRRWKLLRDVVDKHVSKLPKTIDEDIVMASRRFGL